MSDPDVFPTEDETTAPAEVEVEADVLDQLDEELDEPADDDNDDDDEPECWKCPSCGHENDLCEGEADLFDSDPHGEVKCARCAGRSERCACCLF